MPTILEQLLATDDIIESICKWNKARYAQEYNEELTIALLEEEFTELTSAIDKKDTVEIADALGDIFYVAVGAIWKSGVSAEDIKAGLDAIDQIAVPPIHLVIRWYKSDPQIAVLAHVCISAMRTLTALLNSEGRAFAVIRAICDSNDSKVVVKTASHIKANIDKGPNYYSPKAVITKIIQEAEQERENGL